jgi:hypothetical protein
MAIDFADVKRSTIRFPIYRGRRLPRNQSYIFRLVSMLAAEIGTKMGSRRNLRLFEPEEVAKKWRCETKGHGSRLR